MNNDLKKFVVDTNVPYVANYAVDSDDKPSDLPNSCVLKCVEKIEYLMHNKDSIVIDNNYEILTEYRKKLSSGNPSGLGAEFYKWISSIVWTLPDANRVVIAKIENEKYYKEFPHHADLKNFDRSDRKFIAVANKHPENPEILQATDSKWWGARVALCEVGIKVRFLCEDYIKEKYTKKIK